MQSQSGASHGGKTAICTVCVRGMGAAVSGRRRQADAPAPVGRGERRGEVGVPLLALDDLVHLVERVFEHKVAVELVHPGGGSRGGSAAQSVGIALKKPTSQSPGRQPSPLRLFAIAAAHARGRAAAAADAAVASRGAQQLGGLGRVRLGERHKGGAGERVEAVQVKRVGLHQLRQAGRQQQPHSRRGWGSPL